MAEQGITDIAAARVELRALVDEYACICDERDGDRYAALFTADGQVTITSAGETQPTFRAKGTDELRRVLHVDDQFTKMFHAVANHSAVVDGAAGSGVTYTTVHHYIEDAAGARAEVMLSRLDDAYALTDEGWRFAGRRIELQWSETVPADLRPFEEDLDEPASAAADQPPGSEEEPCPDV